MVEEIGRRLVGGVWVTNVASEGGGGGGGTVEEITSDDASVTIVNPTGPVVDLSASGGSQTLAQVLAAGNDGNGAGITNGGQIETGGSDLDVGGGNLANVGGLTFSAGVGPIDLLGAALDTSGGNLKTGGGAFDTEGGNVDGVNDIEINGDLNHDGSAVGFYGTAPAAKPVVPETTPSVQDVIDALVLLGLIGQSD